MAEQEFIQIIWPEVSGYKSTMKVLLIPVIKMTNELEEYLRINQGKPWYHTLTTTHMKCKLENDCYCHNNKEERLKLLFRNISFSVNPDTPISGRIVRYYPFSI